MLRGRRPLRRGLLRLHAPRSGADRPPAPAASSSAPGRRSRTPAATRSRAIGRDRRLRRRRPRTRYLLNNLARHRGLLGLDGRLPVHDRQRQGLPAPTRISYKLNLTGPSVSVQTACSTSLVGRPPGLPEPARRANATWRWPAASRSACRRRAGYLYRAGQDPLARRPLPRLRRGRRAGPWPATAWASWCCKRLADALADGDPIHAVIRGSAVNNDGVAEGGLHGAERRRPGGGDRGGAARSPSVDAATIGYVEAHGTGTPLGDPIEIAALTQAFRGHTGTTRILRDRLGQDATSATSTPPPASPG